MITSDQKMIPPSFLPDHYCVILKSGVRCYVRADWHKEQTIETPMCTSSRGEQQLFAIKETGRVQFFIGTDETRVVAEFQIAEIAGMVQPDRELAERQESARQIMERRSMVRCAMPEVAWHMQEEDVEPTATAKVVSALVTHMRCRGCQKIKPLDHFADVRAQCLECEPQPDATVEERK